MKFLKLKKVRNYNYCSTFWQTTSLNYAVEVVNEKSDGVESRGLEYNVMVHVNFKSFQIYVRADHVQSVGIVCTLTNVRTCRATSNYSYWMLVIGRIYLYAWLLFETFDTCVLNHCFESTTPDNWNFLILFLFYCSEIWY